MSEYRSSLTLAKAATMSVWTCSGVTTFEVHVPGLLPLFTERRPSPPGPVDEADRGSSMALWLWARPGDFAKHGAGDFRAARGAPLALESLVVLSWLLSLALYDSLPWVALPDFGTAVGVLDSCAAEENSPRSATIAVTGLAPLGTPWREATPLAAFPPRLWVAVALAMKP